MGSCSWNNHGFERQNNLSSQTCHIPLRYFVTTWHSPQPFTANDAILKKKDEPSNMNGSCNPRPRHWNYRLKVGVPTINLLSPHPCLRFHVGLNWNGPFASLHFGPQYSLDAARESWPMLLRRTDFLNLKERSRNITRSEYKRSRIITCGGSEDAKIALMSGLE